MRCIIGSVEVGWWGGGRDYKLNGRFFNWLMTKEVYDINLNDWGVNEECQWALQASSSRRSFQELLQVGYRHLHSYDIHCLGDYWRDYRAFHRDHLRRHPPGQRCIGLCFFVHLPLSVKKRHEWEDFVRLPPHGVDRRTGKYLHSLVHGDLHNVWSNLEDNQ